MNYNKESTRIPLAEKNNQKQLSEKVEVLSFMLNRSSETIAAIDPEFRFLSFNAAYQQEFEPVLNQALYPGLHLYDVLDPEVLHEQQNIWERALNGEEVDHISSMLINRQPKKYALRFSCIRNKSGEIVGASQHGRDITNELNIPQEESSLREFSLLANSMPQLIWSSRMDGQHDFINEQLCHYTGKSEKELLEKGWRAYVSPEDQALFLKKLESFRQEKGGFETEFRLQSKDGSYRWFICKVVALSINANTVSKYLCTATDIHAQKLLLDKIELKAKELEHITEAIPQLVWTTEGNGANIYFNQRWHEYSGFDYSTSIDEGWTQVLHPDDKEKTLEAWIDSLDSGQPYKIESRFRRQDGVYRWFFVQAVPLRNKEGEIFRWFGTCTDIHDQKLQRDDLDQKNQQLFQINRYLDEFVHAVAHDLRSPVAGLKLSFELLNQVEEPKRQKILNGCHTYLDRLDNTLKGLVQLIEVQEAPGRSYHDELDIQQLIEQVVQDLQEKIRLANAIVKIGDFQWRTIRYPKPYIYNILRNIIRYALRFKNPEDPLIFNISSQQQADLLMIRIQENGPGINLEKEMKNLFKPFSHINKGSDSQGMGLAIVKYMVEKNGGKILINSSLGKGTVFDVYLKEYSLIQ